MKKIITCLSGMLTILACTGCNRQSGEPIATMPVTDNATQQDLLAGGDETVTPENIVEDGMTPIDGEMILDGVYDIEVNSSSSMFQIVSCELHVSMGKMTATMTMSGTGYLYLFMGTGEEAIKLSEKNYIAFTENENGEYVFTVPVEALDKGIACSAFSKNKQKWYDRTILFRSDSLPITAFDESLVPTVSSLGLEDGEYEISVILEGGSGRASINSPVKLSIQDGQAIAEIIWSSSNYDYMLVDGEKYISNIINNQSVFEIPVLAFNYKLPVSANTTAMSTPHEINYTLYFDTESLVKL
ncbi:MAG: hypothetical protein K2K06_11785 [Oscillospiraceae bacterium]|nr:hypothetical protein [Oscillospiraceae bacterium]